MITKNLVDKSTYPPGEWQGEPDFKVWDFAGALCCVVRGPRGSFNGYATVPHDHPWVLSEECEGCCVEITWGGRRPPPTVVANMPAIYLPDPRDHPTERGLCDAVARDEEDRAWLRHGRSSVVAYYHWLVENGRDLDADLVMRQYRDLWYWVGFDHSHVYDLCPIDPVGMQLSSHSGLLRYHYSNLSHVTAECEHVVAASLAAVQTPWVLSGGGFRWTEHLDRNSPYDLPPELFDRLTLGQPGDNSPGEYRWRDYGPGELSTAENDLRDAAQSMMPTHAG